MRQSLRVHGFSTKSNAMQITKAQATMTSLELVDTINEVRAAEGKKPLRHDNFMVKIEKHPAIDSPKYLGQYKDSTGRELKCYRLPKRECELMVMSESLAVQARVYDKMNELAAPAPVAHSPAQMLVAMAQQFLAYEQEQQRQATEMARIQETVAVIEARTQPENKHFTVLGYANLVGHKIDYREASKIGRKCAELSRSQGLPIGDVKDPRFGKVHSYHESVLQAVIDAVA